MPKHGRKYESEDDYKRDVITVNPRWTEDVGPNGSNDYKNNCTRVSAAWLLRRYFGLNVTALEAPWKDSQNNWKTPTVQTHPDGRLYRDDKDPSKPDGDWYTADILEKWIDPATGNQRDKTVVPTKIADPTAIGGERYMTNEEWIEKVREMILAANPEGSGGLMRITKHIFNWEIKDGKVRFIEAQPQPMPPTKHPTDPTAFVNPGQESYNKWDKDFLAYPGGEWWKYAAQPSDKLNWFMRVDDMEPSKKLFDKNWVQVVSVGERDAPFFEDMVLQSYSLYPGSADDRAAFRIGWDQVRRGRAPRIPTGWRGTPREAPYRAGVTYAKEPQ